LAKHSRSKPTRAFEELVSEHVDSLYRTALRLVAGQTADAEDLLQDTVLRAFEHFGQLRHPDAGRSWLFTILVRTNLNRIRAATRRAEQFHGDLSEREFEEALAAWRSNATPEEFLDRKELAESVIRTLDTLHPELRAAVVLTDVEGFSQREAARMLEIPEGTLASRIFRARRELRQALNQNSTGLRVRERT